MPSSPPAVDNCLQRWRNQLIDLTRRNPLLALKPRRSSYLEITAPPLPELFPLLVEENNRKTWPFWLPPEEEKNGKKNKDGKPKSGATRSPAHILATGAEGEDLKRAELLRVLTNLYRRAHTDFEERGLHVLYLACGILEWRDADDDTLRSPLVLLPVELRRSSLKEPFVLRAADDDAVLNPALEARLLQDFDFPLSPLPDWDEKPIKQYLDELQGAVMGLPGWKVHTTCVLTLFSFFKGVIHQDLGDHKDLVLEHPIVQTLAGLKSSLPLVDVPEEEELDRVQDPTRTFPILDADASQRCSLEAAARSESFVLIGPPGTGKSQTITNLIAENIALGRKVLFVSEKMAALEVVYKRLQHAGLGDYCLELHSHKANKRAVVTELARCLDDRPRPGPMPADDDFRRAQERRWQLQNYVQALHQLREPMHRSVWQILSELPRWQDMPALPLGLAPFSKGDTAGLILSEIPAARIDELDQLMKRLKHLWHVRVDCPWQGFKADRFTLQLRDEILGLVDKVAGRLDKLQQEVKDYSGKVGVSAPLPQLLKLGDMLEHRPPHVHAAWLREANVPGLEADLDSCAHRYQELNQARAPLTDRYGGALWQLAPGTAKSVAETWLHAGGMLAEDGDGARLLAQQKKLRAWAADTQKRLPAWSAEIRTLEKWLGVPLAAGEGGQQPTPANLDPAPFTLRLFLRLVHLCQTDHPPERTWLHNPQELARAQEVITAAKPIFQRYRQGRSQLLEIYTEPFFELELGRMAEAFAGPYRSWLRFFSAQFRKDRRALRRRAKSSEYPASAAQDVLIGKEVVEHKKQIEADQPQRKPLLGRYEKGLDSDVDAADKATRVAAEALSLLHQLGCEVLPARFLDTICSSSPPVEKMRLTAKRLQESFTAWMHATQELKDILPMDNLPGVGRPLEECSLTAICHYAKELQAPLNHLGGLTDPVLGHGSNQPPDMKTLIADLTRAEDFRSVEAQEGSENQSWRERFGPGFSGLSTDWVPLRQALTWTRRVREWFAVLEQKPGTLPVPPEIFLALTAAPPLKDLKHALEHFEQAMHSLEIRFDAPGPVLRGKRLAEHLPESIQAQLAAMRTRVAELETWIDWRHLPERFVHLGLGGFLQSILQAAPEPEQLEAIFWKSFWTAWIDMIFAGDAVLSSFRRAEHENNLMEFRELDQKLVAQGAARVIHKAEQKRAVNEFQKTLLMKEAHKKIKHLPLRRLFESIPELLLELKPCLLMSPLSVSQYLPANPDKVRFDVVVFDEASQILPEDAIGAIYRGDQLVITGDNHQLPPTTFFQSLDEADNGDEEELDEPAVYESVLDAALAAGLPSRMLRWHYRSRHESLIAFSNARFYDGKLVTFPAARDRQPDLGIHFQHVAAGVYERGGRRVNQPEAQAVADLVFEHFRTQPGKTLGVIAFSYPQMTAIQDEIDRRLDQHPDLEKFVHGDRLEGFFIKNLETVQGDERDVILLSVGYGKDADGKLVMNFGPLNRAGGARRLNVAVTRARQKLVVFSSIRARDITASDPDSGLGHLQQYLDFAERGVETLPAPADKDRLPTLTPLHQDVMAELKKLGLDAVPLLGCGSYRLDLAVIHPRQPGHFLLGIELDGPAYASAHTARDRDRLRPAMLAALGWKLHHIWAPDWIAHRPQEIDRLTRAVKL